MSDIAEAAGVPRPSLYRWWPTKQALIADCVLDDVLHLELIVVAASGDLRADLEAWVARSVAAIGEGAAAALFRALLAAAASDERAAEQLSSQLARPLREGIAGAFRAAGRADGELAADALIGAMIGAIVTRDRASLLRLPGLVSLAVQD